MGIVNNKILAIILTLLMSSLVSAQNLMEKIDLGFRLGMGISSVVEYDGDSKSRTGYLAGFFLEYEESPLFSLQMELMYISKGYKIENAVVLDSLGNISDTGDFEVAFSYLEMPVLAKISMPIPGNYHPYLVAGGFASYSLNSNIKFSKGIPFAFDLGNANDIDFGAIAGIGLDMKSGNGSLIMELRYDLSFTEALKNRDHKLRMLTFHIGYAW